MKTLCTRQVAVTHYMHDVSPRRHREKQMRAQRHLTRQVRQPVCMTCLGQDILREPADGPAHAALPLKVNGFGMDRSGLLGCYAAGY